MDWKSHFKAMVTSHVKNGFTPNTAEVLANNSMTLEKLRKMSITDIYNLYGSGLDVVQEVMEICEQNDIELPKTNTLGELLLKHQLPSTNSTA